MSTHSLTEEQIKYKFEKACTAHQNGKTDEAERLYTELLQLFPDAFLLHYNLGLLLQEKDNHEKALSHYLIALQENENDPDLLFNIALCYKKKGEINEAIVHFRKSYQLQPESVDSLYNLAGCYRSQNNWSMAREVYRQVLQIDECYQPALSNLAYTCHRLGETDEALRLYEILIQLNPQHKGALHMIATLKGENLTNTDNEYVTELFDEYSENFEQDLVKTLKYRVPNLLKQQIFQHITINTSFHHVIDLGCGTGLVGLELSQHCKQLTGIDLSAKMIEKAREKNIYTALYSSDIIDFLHSTEDTFDMVIAADVFSYIGELNDTFRAISEKTEKTGFLSFSIEKVDSSKELELGATGRFKHSEKYILHLCRKYGFELINKTEADLRQEAGTWVKGVLFLLKKVSD